MVFKIVHVLCTIDLCMIFPDGDTGKCTGERYSSGTEAKPDQYPNTKHCTDGTSSRVSFFLLHVLKQSLHFTSSPDR